MWITEINPKGELFKFQSVLNIIE